MDERKIFTLDPVAFADLTELIADIRARGMRAMVILVRISSESMGLVLYEEQCVSPTCVSVFICVVPGCKNNRDGRTPQDEGRTNKPHVFPRVSTCFYVSGGVGATLVSELCCFQDPFLISNETGYRPFDLGLERDVFIKWPPGLSPDHDVNQNDILLGWVSILLSFRGSCQNQEALGSRREGSHCHRPLAEKHCFLHV